MNIYPEYMNIFCVTFLSLGSLLKGENAEIWRWGLCRNNLPVTCRDQQGTLSQDKLAKGALDSLIGGWNL